MSDRILEVLSVLDYASHRVIESKVFGKLHRLQITTDFIPTCDLHRDIRYRNMEKYKCYTHLSQVYYSYLPVPIIEMTTAALKTIFGNELFIFLFFNCSIVRKSEFVERQFCCKTNKWVWLLGFQFLLQTVSIDCHLYFVGILFAWLLTHYRQVY